MTWTITLEVVDCASAATKLAGALVKMGVDEIGLTDATGRIDAVVDDFNTLPIFKFSKADYNPKNAIFDKEVHAGTVQTVCLENPSTIPDGHDPNVPGESGGQEFGGDGCFIVTAATGSASSFEVNELRALRERVRARSHLGAQLIEAIYAEYASFSPAIAAQLHEDGPSRGLVLAFVVRPLFAWYRLAGLLGFEPDAKGAQREAVRALAEACPGDAPGAMILELLEGLRSGAPLPAFAPPMLQEITPRLGAFDFVPWAILDPLVRISRLASERRDPVEQIADWLAAAPLQRLKQPENPADLDAELATIAGFLAFAPASRTALGKRLLAAWPDAAAAMAKAGLC